MVKFNWIKSGFILLSVAAVFWVVVAWLYPVSSNHYNPSEAYSSQKITSEAFMPPLEIHPIYKTTKKQSEKEIEEWRASRSDLAAQWKTADMSQLAFRIGVLGVILLFWTIYQTLDAGTELRRQNEIAISASLPFLDVVAAKVVRGSYNSGSLEIAVRNLGTSPAKNVQFSGIYTQFKASDDQGVFHNGDPILENVKSEKIAVSTRAYNVIDVPFSNWQSLEEHLADVSDTRFNEVCTVEQVFKHIRFEGEITFNDHMGGLRSFNVNLHQHARFGSGGYDLNGTGRHPSASYYESNYGNVV